MDQAEFWRRCERDFHRYSAEEGEQLVVHWESTSGDIWRFEGPADSARTFKILAKQAGHGLTGERGPDAWKSWLDGLRRYGYDSRVPLASEARVSQQERQARRLLESDKRRKRGPLGQAIMKRQAAAAEKAMLSFEALTGVIETPFKKSALFCLELAVDASIEPEEPDKTTESQEFDWATFLLEPAMRLTEEFGAVNSTDRRAAVDAYIEEVLKETGRRITRTEIWKSAGYKTRTEFERWERNDPNRPNTAAHKTFTDILTKKPHLK